MAVYMLQYTTQLKAVDDSSWLDHNNKCFEVAYTVGYSIITQHAAPPITSFLTWIANTEPWCTSGYNSKFCANLALYTLTCRTKPV